MTSAITPDQFLYGRLAGDATLAALVGNRIYSDVAPAQAVYPLVVFAHQSGTVLRVVGPTIVWWNEVFAIKVIGEQPQYTALAPIIDRIVTLLHAASGAVAGGRVVSCEATLPMRFLEIREGKQFRHLGHLFRLYHQ